ncbi:MAG: carboxypeptidase-like regulatory domain-containing protein [Flavobacterium sp.]|nr:carboxypeptidase-like regulatory domain-containing protein [Flavobacterium sp.]
MANSRKVNMIKALQIIVFLIVSTVGLQAQVVFEGIVKDIDTKENIAYVNIGILNKNVGTVTDVAGKFSIPLDGKYDDETLKISIIGYKSRDFKVGNFKKEYTKNSVIYLEKNIAELKEVVINGNLKTAVLGNPIGKKGMSAGFIKNLPGNEIGIPVKIKKSPTYIEAFHAMVAYNNYKDLKFRINFYDLKDGKPNNTILTENIIATSNIKNGELTIDLSGYNIVAESDFFMSIELIENLGEGGLHFLVDEDGPRIMSRAASHGKWIQQEDVSFGFTVTTRY